MSDEKKVLKFEWVDNPDQIGERNFTFDGEKFLIFFKIIHMS